MQDAVARFLRRILVLRQRRAEILHVASVVRVRVDVVRLEAEIHGSPRIPVRLQSRLQPEREPAHRIAAVARGKLDVRPVRERLEAPRERHRRTRDECAVRVVPRADSRRAARIPARDAHRPRRTLVGVRRHGLGEMQPLHLVAFDLEDRSALDRQAESPILHRAQIAREPVAAGEFQSGVRLLRRSGLVAAEDDPLHVLRGESERRSRVRALPDEFAFSKCREPSVKLRAVRELEHLIARGIRLRGLLGFLRRAAGEHHAAIHDLHTLGLLRRAIVEDVGVEALDDFDLRRAARCRVQCGKHSQHRGKQRADFHRCSWISVRRSEDSGSSARSTAARAPCRSLGRGPRPSSRHRSANR